LYYIKYFITNIGEIRYYQFIILNCIYLISKFVKLHFDASLILIDFIPRVDNIHILNYISRTWVDIIYGEGVDKFR
jgi:hypothetical protein